MNFGQQMGVPFHFIGTGKQKLDSSLGGEVRLIL